MTLPSFVCGAGGAPDDALHALVGLATCCPEAAVGNPADCTCWETVFDREQAPVDLTSTPGVQEKMCENCAYRPDSPESRGDERYRGKPTDPAATFWCHQGMRRAVAHRHDKLGITVAASGEFYKPPIVEIDGEAVPFRADGSAGLRCAGWAAHRRADGEALAGLALAAHEDIG